MPISSQLEFIADHIEKGDDVAVGFRASDVYDGSKAVGHVALIESVDTKLDKVILIDPDMGTDEGVVVSWPRLFAGIASVSDGFWLFGGDPIVLKAQTTI